MAWSNQTRGNMQINNKAKISICFVFQPAVASEIVELFRTSDGVFQVILKAHSDNVWWQLEIPWPRFQENCIVIMIWDSLISASENLFLRKQMKHWLMKLPRPSNKSLQNNQLRYSAYSYRGCSYSPPLAASSLFSMIWVWIGNCNLRSVAHNYLYSTTIICLGYTAFWSLTHCEWRSLYLIIKS